MNTNTTLTNDTNSELSLGWNSLPAYGEVMAKLIGTSHTDVKSTLDLGKKSLVKSFWTTLSNLK